MGRWGWGWGSLSGSQSPCLIFTTLLLPVSLLTSPSPRVRHQIVALGAEKPVFTSNASPSIRLHPPSPSQSSERRGPSAPVAPVPLSISFSSVLPLLFSSLCLFFFSFCSPTSARAAGQITCDIGCTTPEPHPRWELLFMTQMKFFSSVIPPNC